MEVVTLLMYVGAVWVLAAILFFAWNLFGGSFEHADRLALLPLDDNQPGLVPNDSSRAAHSPACADKEERGEAT